MLGARSNMLERSIALCTLLAAVAAKPPPHLKYKGSAGKGVVTALREHHLAAYIPDNQCSAMIAFPSIVPCEPIWLRVEATDAAPYPEVSVGPSLHAEVRRQGPCRGDAPVDVHYACRHHHPLLPLEPLLPYDQLGLIEPLIESASEELPIQPLHVERRKRSDPGDESRARLRLPPIETTNN